MPRWPQTLSIPELTQLSSAHAAEMSLLTATAERLGRALGCPHRLGSQEPVP